MKNAIICVKMDRRVQLVLFFFVLCVCSGGGQITQFGSCSQVDTVEYFQLESFLGDWYEIERFPSWYEHQGQCAIKRIQYCNRRIEIEHVFVKDGIEFVLHVNSTYAPGDEAVFVITENSVDPVGIPMLVIATNYKDYAVVYGCKYNEELNIKYVSAWILSRERTLSEEHLHHTHDVINQIPGSSTAYLEPVMQDEQKCSHFWTAHVEAENVTDSMELAALLAKRV